MANVADTKLYDILGVPPGASENELKKVLGSGPARQGVRGAGLLRWDSQAAPRGGPRAGGGGPRLGAGDETGLLRPRTPASADLGPRAPPARRCSK